MRIKFYQLIITLISTVFFSCSKGDSIKDPQFGNITIDNQASGVIHVLEGEDRNLSSGTVKISLVAGLHRFRFYDTNALLLDTLLSVEPFTTHNYFMVRPTLNSDLKIYDESLNKFNAEPLPDPGTVKISLANLSSSLPNKVNISITAITYNSNQPEEIQVGEFLNVNAKFSDFQLVTLGKDISSNPQSVYAISIKDTRNNEILATTSIDFPKVEGSQALLYDVYVIYFNGNNSAKILMGK